MSEATGRVPSRTAVAAWVAIVWTLFQLWMASPLPVWFGIGQFAVAQTRALHLAFALLLCFLLVPAVWRLPGRVARLLDPALGAAGAFCAGYVFLFYTQLSTRPGDPSARAERSVNLDVGETVFIDSWAADGTAQVKYRGAIWTAIHRPGVTPAIGAHRVAELVGNRLLVDPL